MKYLVMSPEYSVRIPVTDEGEGPDEPCREVVEIEADNAADARVLGLKLLRSMRSYHDWKGWISDNDFAGVVVVREGQR